MRVNFFKLPKSTTIVFDVFSNRFDPDGQESKLSPASQLSYCITRNSNFEDVAGPEFARLTNNWHV